MRITYETGFATMIQLIILAFLNIAGTIDSIVTTCQNPNGDCVGNTLTSIIYYILIVLWFGFIAFLGYLAQTKRNKLFSRLLIMSEMAVTFIALINIYLGINSTHNNALNSLTSFLDLILSVWIISLAYRILKAKGGRVVLKRHIQRSQPED